jgi:hypothetical protein
MSAKDSILVKTTKNSMNHSNSSIGRSAGATTLLDFNLVMSVSTSVGESAMSEIGL